MRSKLVAALLRHRLERPAAIAIREVGGEQPERAFDWGALGAAAAGLARRLEAGGRRGALVVCAGNRFEAVAGIVAGLWAGLRVAPVAPESTASELRGLCAGIGAATAIGSPETLSALEGHVEEGIPAGEIAPGAAEPFVEPSGRGEGSLLLRSSGTTGAPKTVRRTAVALDAVGESCRIALGMDERDAMLLAIPAYHSYGIDMGVLTGIAAGALLELHAGFDVKGVRASLAERSISVFPAVPVMLDSLARGVSGRLPAPALRRVISAGSPLGSEVAERFAAVFGVRVGQIYGASEFGSVAYNDPDAWDESRGEVFRPACVGRPFPGVRVRVLEGDDPLREVPPGAEGQIAVAAPSMLAEYLEDGGEPTRDGFLLTGDLGRIDSQGRLDLTGRVKLMIDVGGLKVNPLEVESVLARYPGVREVVAVPIPYSATASRLKAIIIPEPGVVLTRDEIRRFAREHLIHYKVPRSFEITSDVPRSPTGKILRQQLLAGLAR